MNNYIKTTILLISLVIFFVTNLRSQNETKIDYEYLNQLLTDKNKTSIVYIDSLIKQYGPSAYLLYAKGVYYINKDRFELAKRFFYKTIEIDSLYYDAYYNLGVIYHNQGVEAHNLAYQPESYEQLEEDRAKGTNYYRLALKYFEEAKKLNPNDELQGIIDDTFEKIK
jgi:tetratricopeptide (TPR) repeat protein